MTGEIHGTIMKTWNQRAQYSSLLSQSRVIQDEETNNQSPCSSLTQLDPEIHQLWMQELRKLGGVHNDNVHKITSTMIYNKRFTVHQLDKGKNHSNSYVEIMQNSVTLFGQIIELFVQSDGKDIWFVVQLFKEPQINDAEDPYKAYPNLNVRVVSTEVGNIVVVREKEIVGHVAVLKNDAGTFGYPDATMTLVSLARVVSFPLN